MFQAPPPFRLVACSHTSLRPLVSCATRRVHMIAQSYSPPTFQVQNDSHHTYSDVHNTPGVCGCWWTGDNHASPRNSQVPGRSGAHMDTLAPATTPCHHSSHAHTTVHVHLCTHIVCTRVPPGPSVRNLLPLDIPASKPIWHGCL
jgi:hypothetical protein